MNQNLIILPVFAQVLLIIAVLVVMGARRRRALLSKSTSIKEIALGQDAWPAEAMQASNNYKNQFEMPVLFFAACAFALITKSVDIWMLGLASLFVMSRLLHTFVHLSNNHVQTRAIWFLVGSIIVLLMWLLLILRAVVPVL